MSAQSQIRDAVVALLTAAPALAGGRIYAKRARPISSDKATAIVVRVENSRSHLADVLGGRTSWATHIVIECYGRATDGSEPADDTVVAVFERLAADPGLGGAAMDTAPLEGQTLAWDADDQDSNLECITARFMVLHQTQGRTLAA